MRPRKSGSRIPRIFLPSKYFPQIASGIWGARNRFVICWVEFIRISCGWAHELPHTYLIPSRGAHKSVLLKEVVNPTRNGRRVFWEIVQFDNFVLHMVNKLRSYPRVFLPYLSHLVSVRRASGGVMSGNQCPLTNFMLSGEASIFPASDMSLRA